MRAGVFGVGAAVPEDVITNAHFAARLDTSDEWIVKRTGIQQRYRLNGAQTLADIAVDACAAALACAGPASRPVTSTCSWPTRPTRGSSRPPPRPSACPPTAS